MEYKFSQESYEEGFDIQRSLWDVASKFCNVLFLPFFKHVEHTFVILMLHVFLTFPFDNFFCPKQLKEKFRDSVQTGLFGGLLKAEQFVTANLVGNYDQIVSPFFQN